MSLFIIVCNCCLVLKIVKDQLHLEEKESASTSNKRLDGVLQRTVLLSIDFND